MAALGVIMSSWAVWLLGLIALTHLVCVTQSVVQCSDLVPIVSPCVDFAFGVAVKPSDACCAGVGNLEKTISSSQPDRKAACLCLKKAIASLPINLDRVNQIPKMCSLTFDIPITKDMDCDKI